jgi:type II secretory pathway pseudopilin PulG
VYHVLMTWSRRWQGSRPAFSIVEILVALTILGILGVMFTRILLTQSRFTDQMHAVRGARTVSRQAMNLLESELRMVQDSGGIDSVTANGLLIRVLVPYRFGLICGVTAGKLVVSMLPVDSLTLAQARYTGFAWRNNNGRYTNVFPAAPQGADAPTTTVNPNDCTGSGTSQAEIKTLSLAGRSGTILGVSPAPTSAPKGQAVFFFQRITYFFEATQAYPGMPAYGLYRTVQGGPTEEIMAPFDYTARFRYWAAGASSAVSAPPALSQIRGVDLYSVSQSGYTPMGKTSPSKSTAVGSIFFKNVR